MDHHWASDNPTSGSAFFTPGYIPYQAHCELGFPRDVVVPTSTDSLFPNPTPVNNTVVDSTVAEGNKENTKEDNGEGGEDSTNEISSQTNTGPLSK